LSENARKLLAKKELLTDASPRVALRIICTKMKCLPSRLIYNLLAWGTNAPFLARTTHVTRVSTANLFQRAEACQTRLEILPTSPKKYYVRIHTNIFFFLLYVSFLSVVYSTIINLDVRNSCVNSRNFTKRRLCEVE